jgi:SsrA-binding protein
MNQKVEIKNRKAKFEYEFLDVYTAGIKLTGTEIKSLRNHKASIAEAYCYVHNTEAFVKNMFIAEYEQGGYTNHEPRRERKLLMNKHEIEKIEKKLKDKGITIVPTKLFINENGFAKLTIAVARGKKIYDKRDTIKDKDIKRDLDRSLK